MKELSLNILDIAENSVRAGASRIDIRLTEANGFRTLIIRDNGCGMSPEMTASVTDPFTTTRTTRSIGMGIPLLKLAADQADGSFSIASSQDSEAHGTTVTATFRTEHVDCVPVGDLASTLVTLIQGSPDIDFSLFQQTPEGEKSFDTAEIRAVLGSDIPLGTPDVLQWIRDVINSPFETE